MHAYTFGNRWMTQLVSGLLLVLIGLGSGELFGQGAQADYRIFDLKSGAMAQQAQAPADLLTNPLYTTTKMVFRRIPAGTVVMGDGSFEVDLTQDYWLGVFPCTQGQWETVMGNNPSRYQGANRPVEQVSWQGHARHGTVLRAGQWPDGDPDDASFMARMRALGDGRYRFDLPTEAQWERAGRAGTTSEINTGADLTGRQTCENLDAAGRYSGNFTDGRGGHTQHTAVGSYAPNAWGLYDMHGNVWEWCLDWYWRFPAESAVDYPGRATQVSGRVVRGGSWRESAWFNAIGIRSSENHQHGARSDVGFRVAIQP